jgi:hypothetical protein
MKRKVWWLVLLAAMLWGQAAWADDFYVIAGGGVGTKITSLPYTINSSGFYYLTGNLTFSGSGAAIYVNADNVTIELMGFSLTGPGNQINSGPHGIFMSSLHNVEVRNGTVSGFFRGVYDEGAGDSHRVINVRAANNFVGIWLSGNNHLIKNCNGSNNNNFGLYVDNGIVMDNVACTNGIGISVAYTGVVIGNMAYNNGLYNFAFGVLGVVGVSNILVDRNSAAGLSTNYYIFPGRTGVVFGTNAGTP